MTVIDDVVQSPLDESIPLIVSDAIDESVDQITWSENLTVDDKGALLGEQFTVQVDPATKAIHQVIFYRWDFSSGVVAHGWYCANNTRNHWNEGLQVKSLNCHC